MKQVLQTILGVLLLLALVGPMVVADTPPAAPPVHVVRWGENLTWIAAHYGVSVQAIVNANGLSDPNRIYAGQRLVIPVAGPSSPSTSADSSYVVQYGDTLSGIAYRFGVTVDALVQANGLVNPNWIYAGQRLTVPGAASPAPAPAPTTTYYTVQKGDTLAKIAVRFDVRIWDIVTLNNIANPNLIYAGQRLAVPKTFSATSSTSSRPGCEHLTWPREGAVLSGVVKVTGTAKIDNMWYYKLEYRQDGLDNWHYLAGAEKTVVNGLLGEWNTRQVSNGPYTLRLVLVDWSGNYPPPCEVHVRVSNR